MKIICNNCGKQLDENEKICPFCNCDIQEQNSDVYNKLNDKFKEKIIDIKYNLRNIVNEQDYKQQYENNKIELVDKKFQYLDTDLTKENEERIDEINQFYIKQLDKYMKNEKHKLEIAGADDLKDVVSNFNDIVNNCMRYREIVTSKKIKKNLTYTIDEYNSEINYIKKYFVLPLYESEKLLAQSRIAKNLLNVICIFLVYVVFSKISFFDTIYKHIIDIFNYGNISYSLRYCDLNALVSYMVGLGITEVLFAYYISFTIKNRNFKVDKNKNYEPIYYFVPIFYFVAILAPVFSYIYNICLIAYLAKLSISSIMAKRNSLLWISFKVFTIIISIIIAVSIKASIF